jgi:hypothetical protein
MAMTAIPCFLELSIDSSIDGCRCQCQIEIWVQGDLQIRLQSERSLPIALILSLEQFLSERRAVLKGHGFAGY